MTRSISTLVIAFEAAALAAAVNPAAAPDSLLRQASAQAARFQEQFPSVACTEILVQTKVGEHGKVLVRKRSTYDYLVLLQTSADELTVDESRVLQGKEQKASDRALLTTSGFSTLLLIFHPFFDSSFHFTSQGTDPLTGYQRIRFEHIHGQRSPSVLQLRGRDYPIDWQGMALVDAKSGNVARISAGLMAPLDDIGLKKLQSDVRYAPVHFASAPDVTAWMPESATVEADTTHQHWRNEHQFSRYRLFSVDADSKAGTPK